MLEEQEVTDPNIEEPEMWESLSQTFQSTADTLRREAAEYGVDLTDPKLIEETTRHKKAVDDLAEAHAPLLHIAKDYTEFVKEFLDASGSLNDPIRARFESPLFVEEPPPEGRQDLLNALETISYYHIFIYIKLTRAVLSWAGEKLERWEGMEGMPKDSDGSCKVALIGIDRSWNSWASLRRHIEDEEHLILGGLKRLSVLRAATEAAFPEARAFVRPGFDTGE